MKPGKKYLSFLLVHIFSFGCGHSLSGDTDDEKVSRCILPGYDSVVYYYGSSNKNFLAVISKIVIEPTDEAAYKNTLDIPDKMTTNNVGKYELRELSNEDEAFIKTLK